MTITVKQLIKQLEKMDPKRCVYIEADDGHYLELEEDGAVEDQDGIVAIRSRFYYMSENGELI